LIAAAAKFSGGGDEKAEASIALLALREQS
jgi:hypothetical protein